MLPIQLLDTYKKWAVIGVSTNKEKYGYKIYKKFKENDYEVYGVNPNYEEVDGDKIYNSLNELPEKVDVVNFVVNPKIGYDFLKQCIQLGIKYIWLQPGTVSEDILSFAAENGIEVVQACVLVCLGYK